MADTTPPTDTQGDERKALTKTVDGAIRHRLKWASLHWGTEAVSPEAWPHLVDAVVDALLAARPVPAATHTDPAVQALQPFRDLLALYDGWQGQRDHPGSSSPRQRDQLRAALAEADRLAAQAPAPTPGQRTVTVPEPHVPFGPKGVEPREATASYLAEAAARVRDQRYWGSNVTDAVAKLLEDTVAAIRGDS